MTSAPARFGHPKTTSHAWRVILLSVLSGACLASVVTAPAGARRGVFTEVVAFATKTDFRIAVAWETTQPVEAVIRYGPTKTQLTETVTPAGLPASPAQMTFVDVEGGGDVYLVVEDVKTGDRSPVQHVVPANAYRNYDRRASVYTINLAVSLDAEGSPEAASDADLRFIAAGVDVMAERVYDALDGHVRIGQVLISDAPLGRQPHIRTFQYDDEACSESAAVGADVLFMTAFPSSSEVNGKWTIDDPCGVIFLGRVGPYGDTWRDELHLGGIMTHELMHYAFGLADQYPKPAGIEDGDANCTNDRFDMSLMNTAPSYSNGRWSFTELDRNAKDTPCEHGTVDWSWPTLVERYRKVASSTPNVPMGIIDRMAIGNPDGGAVRIWLLDHAPGMGASLERFVPQG